MIDGGGLSLRGDMTEMKYSLRILTFEKYKSLSEKFRCIYFGHSWGLATSHRLLENKRNSVINTRLNRHSELSYNSNLMWCSRSEREGKSG